MDLKGLTALNVSFIKEQVQTIRLRQDSQELRFITIFVFLLHILWQTEKAFEHNLKCYSIKLYFEFYFIKFTIVTRHILSSQPLRYGKPLTRSNMFNMK